jgi:hypothetical protein
MSNERIADAQKFKEDSKDSKYIFILSLDSASVVIELLSIL